MPESTVRPPRVSAYQARIERSLTDIYLDVPLHSQASEAWQLVGVAHTNGYASCELCGHTPIKRLFFIQNRETQGVHAAGTTLMIGSECARNYARVDLVDAYMNRLVRQQDRTRVTARRNAAMEERRAQYAARETAREATRAAWRAANPELVAWLNTTSFSGSDSFLASIQSSFRTYGSLTEAQTAAADRIRLERTSTAPRPQNAADLAATPDQVPHIYNGTYTMDNGSRHLTFQIYTVTRGPLVGKRIVKRQLNYMEFQGFAFVGADGSLILWRRFAEQADELYVRWARILLAGLNDRTNDAPGIDQMTITGNDPTPTRFTVQRTRSCRRCNRTLTVPTSIESGIGPECARRSESDNRTVVADAHRPVAATPAPAAPRVVPASAPRPVVGPSPVIRQLELSELGTGMVR